MSAGEIILSVNVVAVCLICSLFDIRAKSVPNYVLASSLAFTLIFTFLFARPVFPGCLLSAGLAGLFYFTVRLVSHKKLGFADVLFGIFQGLVLSVTGLFICVAAECFAAFILFLFFSKRNSVSFAQSFVFIPCMSFGTIFAYFLIL